jgi:hypothetical protein
LVLAPTAVLLPMRLRAIGIANTGRKLKNLALVLSEEVDHALQAADRAKTCIAVLAGEIIALLAGLTTRANREPAMASS